jgi:hypothetical protein
MAERREGKFPPPWGAMQSTPAPATCPASSSWSSTNTYQPALAAGAPKVAEFCATEILFFANISTNGTNPYLVGTNPLLGGTVNNPKDLILPMNPGLLNSTDFEWFIDIWLPAGVPVTYQYVLEEGNGKLYFEDRTRVVKPSKCGWKEVVVSDFPKFAGGTS